MLRACLKSPEGLHGLTASRAINIPLLRSDDTSNSFSGAVSVGTFYASQVTPTFLSSRLEASTNVSRVGGAERLSVIYGLVKIINYTNAREGCSIRPHSGEGSVGHSLQAGRCVSLSLRVCGMSDLRPATSVESHFRRRKASAVALKGRVPVVVRARKRVT